MPVVCLPKVNETELDNIITANWFMGKPKPAVSLQTLRPLLGTIKFTFEFKQKFFFRTFCFKTMLYVMVHDNGKQMLIILYALVQIVEILS